MRRKTYPLLAFLLLFTGVCAWAQDTSPQAGLTLDDCIRIALETQSDILVGNNSLMSTRARATQAKSDYYPQVSAQRTETHADSDTRSSTWSDSGSLTVTQNIYDGGLREARVTSARASVRQNEQGLERTRQSITYEVTRNYFALLRALRLADVQDARVKYLEEQQTMVKTRAQLGAAAEVDVLPVEAQYANAQVDRLSAKNAVQTAAIQLQNAMGLAPATDFSVAEYPVPETTVQPLKAYMARALASRPEVLQAQASVIVAKSSVKTARIALYPRPDVSGQYDQSLVGSGRNEFTITGGLYYDIFDGGRNRAARRDAEWGLSSAQIRAAQVEKDIRSDVQLAWLSLVNAKERMAASDLSLSSAQKNYDVQESRYKQGLAIPLDLLNAQVQLVSAKSSAVQARYDYCTALAQLEFAVGARGGLNEEKK